MRIRAAVAAILAVTAASFVQASEWSAVDPAILADDDIARHAGNTGFLNDIAISEIRFSENGFDWQLLRFTNAIKPDGPLWVVPHDDENAAFEAMIAAIKRHGGTGLAVNSGPSSARNQYGLGRCGDRAKIAQTCDPNRNFSLHSPLFTKAFLKQWRVGQPIIALHTNTPGYGAGKGDITILDRDAEARGKKKPRRDGHFGNGRVATLNDPDVYAIIPYRAEGGLSSADISCRTWLNKSGVHIWHERVRTSDGSLSNYIALNRPDIRYANMEAKKEPNLTTAASAQGLMVDAYLTGCS